tara:strand:+ start:245 stop:1381 length:1137 start_codon:yes stop_codon:yes gene_type:complete
MILNRRSFGEGPSTSLFTFGTMRSVSSKEQMCKILREAYYSEINHIETSAIYGRAEEYLGSSINKLDQEGICSRNYWLITSKIIPGGSFEKSKKKLKEILKRLRLEKIDNLAIHGLNLKEHLEWTLKGPGNEFIKWAKSKELITQVGFSSHGDLDLIQEAIDSDFFSFCSLHLHLFDQSRIPIAKHALKKNMGVMAISPVDKGGKLQNPSKILNEDCAPLTPIELAYKFLISQGISTLTLGASKAEDFTIPRKFNSSDYLLNETEVKPLMRLKEKGRQRLGNTYCGQCRECLPCPNQIPISEILRLRNLSIGHDLYEYTKERYNLINRAGHWWETINASACNNCGECIPRCPNNLNIPELLKETHTKLLDKPRRRLWS